MSNPPEYVVYSYTFGDQVYQIKPENSQPNVTTLRAIGATLCPANVVQIIPASQVVRQTDSPKIRIVENIQVQQPTNPPPVEPVHNDEAILYSATTGEPSGTVPVMIQEVQISTDGYVIVEAASEEPPEKDLAPETVAVSGEPVAQVKVKPRAKYRKRAPKTPKAEKTASIPPPDVVPEEPAKPVVAPKKAPLKAKKNFIYECDICDSRFLSALSLKLHKTGHRYAAAGDERKAFRCRFCGRQFSHLQTLGDHEKVHIDDRYNCAACGTKYSSKSGLRNHLVKNAPCNISYQDRKVQRQKEEEDSRQHGCDVCGKTYRHRKSMVEHRSLHFKSKQHRCGRCGAMFETTGGWRKHTANRRCEFSKKLFKEAGDGGGGDGAEVFIPSERKRFLEQVERLKEKKILKNRKRRLSESSDDGASAEIDPKDYSDDSEQDEKPAIEMVTITAANEDDVKDDSPDTLEPALDAVAIEPLEIKDEVFSDDEPHVAELYEDRDRDSESMTEQTTNAPEEEFTKEVIRDSDCLTTHEEPKEKTEDSRKRRRKPSKARKSKIHQCPKCPKTFSRGYVLTNHMRTHTGERNFLCDSCPKSFADSAALKLHVVVHTGEKPFACPECPSRFARKCGLRNHVTMHYNLPCDECDQMFPSRKTLMRHKIKHQGIRPFLCEICSKDFRTKADMKAHLRIHSNEKRYCCKICSARFNCPSTLRRHRNVHAPPETRPICDTCGKTFSSAQALRKHEDIHKDLRPFRCDICAKSFRVKDHLKIHQRSHSGDKPFGCDLCDKRFVSNGDLKVHYRRHTGEKPFVCDECGAGFVVTSGLYRHQQQSGHRSNKPQAIIVQEYTRAT